MDDTPRCWTNVAEASAVLLISRDYRRAAKAQSHHCSLKQSRDVDEGLCQNCGQPIKLVRAHARIQKISNFDFFFFIVL